MKRVHLAVLLVFLPVLLYAQDKDLEKEIMEYSENRSQLIPKGRKLLMDKFLEGDIAKVKQIKDYMLKEAQNQDYVALYPGEQWMIMYWTGEHEQLKEAILQYKPEPPETYLHKIFPEEDILYTKLIERSWDNLSMLEDKILNSNLDPQAVDFLLLHLNFMVSGEPLMKLSPENVNSMATLYLETYPDSPYETFIKTNIRYKYEPSKWGIGIEFFSGFGMFTGELSEMYNNHGVLGVAFDLEYNKFTLFLRNYIGFANTRQDREIDGVLWTKGSPAQMFFPEASLGYAVIENDKIKISPFAGVGGASIGPGSLELEERPELDALEIGFSPFYTIGFNFDIKLGWDTSIISTNEDKSYWFVRIRYGYTMPQFGNYPLHSGNVHQITIGMGGLYRGMKRVL